MRRLIELRERARIETHLRRDPALHLYELGDLDPFFWPSTRWWGLEDRAGVLEALALLYQGPGVATLLALHRRVASPLPELLRRLPPDPVPSPLPELLRRLQAPDPASGAAPLPDRLHAHLSPGLAPCLAPRWRAGDAVHSLKLVLAHPERLEAVAGLDAPDLRPLTPADQPAVEAFYAEAYPANWFDRRMLETGQYVGLWRDGTLAAAAGVHVYSPRTRVAALGNIATSPGARRQGLARRLTARLCRSLLETVDTVGLNVYAANPAAIALYRGLGFEEVAPYEEWWLSPSVEAAP